MAVPMAASRAVPMAVPMETPAPTRASQMVALGFLALSLASMWRGDSVVGVARVAIDGLRSHQVLALDLDAADLPAMDPSVARVLDPRTVRASLLTARTRPVAVQSFEYEVREGESLQDIAARFGTDVSALLWNNGLDGPDQLQAGARLTILPVRGVLHLVKAGETLAAIAEKYGSRLEDVIAANALERPDRIIPGQVIVVAGGSVPMPLALTEQNVQTVDLAAKDAGSPASADVASPTIAVGSAAPREEELPIPPGAARWQRDFILAIAPGARESQRRSGVPASVTLAQAILESDWGRSRLSREANNLFGIKAQREPGNAGTYEINTWEVYGGQSVTVLAAFKAYQSIADSIADHGRWFHDNRRYQDALAVKDDPRAFAYAINAAGYATDPAYAPKLIGLMDKFNLYAYDVQPGE
jgi:flagellum-specific peptidoglycan hydrolase FlgJ